MNSDARIPALDGLRGIAILLILLLHTFGLGVVHSDAIVWKVFNAGWVGVDLFFVISGYLITGILLDTRRKQGYFRIFFIRRFLRIFPPYYFFLTGIVILGLVVPRLHTEAFSRLLDNQMWLWTYTSNIKLAFTHQFNVFGWFGPDEWFHLAHFWSLAIEEQFYLFWPFVIAFFPPRRLPWLIIGLCGAALAARIFFVQAGNNFAAYFFTLCRTDTLGAGALVACIQRAHGIEFLLKPAKVLAPITGTVIAGLAILRGNYSNIDSWVATLGYSLNAAFFAAVLTMIIQAPPNSVLQKAVAIAPLRFMGKYSYSVYITHTLISNPLALRFFHEPDAIRDSVGSLALWLAIMFAWTLVVSYAVAIILWQFLESPILSLKRFAPYPTHEKTGINGMGVSAIAETPK